MIRIYGCDDCDAVFDNLTECEAHEAGHSKCRGGEHTWTYDVYDDDAHRECQDCGLYEHTELSEALDDDEWRPHVMAVIDPRVNA